MIRKIIEIDEELCNGCGLCVSACHEAAIGMVNGKAKLLRDDYCDGLGNCLPVCPTGAITFVEREALAYDEEAVQANLTLKAVQGGGCPGSRMMSFERREEAPTMGGCPGSRMKMMNTPVQEESGKDNQEPISQLRQWPVQIQLVPVNAPYFSGADLLIAADCTAFAYGDFHRFMKGKITLIGCPKLDEVDYSEKLAQILARNDINSITVIRMEVPCCGGIVHAVQTALRYSGKMIPWRAITISTDGFILDDRG